MNFEHAQNRSDLLHFGTRIKQYLWPFSRMRIDESGGTGSVTGLLNLSHDDIQTSICAKCSFEFVANWDKCLPIVRTDEPWLRHGGAEWHMFSNGSLCYLYAQHWRDDVPASVSQYDIATAAAFAASWCVRSVKWLLYRHHFAFEHGIKRWPAEWPFWPHGQKAESEYEKFKRRYQKLAKATAA